MDTNPKPNPLRLSVRTAGLLIALVAPLLAPPDVTAKPSDERQVRQQNCDAVAAIDQHAARLGTADAALQRLRERDEQLRFEILATVPANNGCKGDIKVSVDKKIKPSLSTLPGYQRGTTRPVAAV